MDLDRPEGNEIRSRLTEFPREEAVLSREVYALLAQANLLRVRGHWEEAAQKCMAALRLAPDSSSANSLLGDIYENQGRYDDAAQWYRMALDVDPDSPADRLKLDLLSRREEAYRDQSRPMDPIGVGMPDRTGASAVSSPPPSPWLRRVTREPEVALRIGSFGAAFALILIVTLAFSAARHAGSLSGLGFDGDPVVKSAPLVVPPLRGALSVDPDAGPLRDPSEQSLLNALQGVRDLSAIGVAVYDVEVDPRTARTVVTFGLPVSPALTQGQIARDALQVLQAAAQAGPVPETYTARCLLIPSGPNTTATLGFIGDVSRDVVLASQPSGLTDAEAVAAFSNAWWSSTANINA